MPCTKMKEKIVFPGIQITEIVGKHPFSSYSNVSTWKAFVITSIYRVSKKSQLIFDTPYLQQTNSIFGKKIHRIMLNKQMQ